MIGLPFSKIIEVRWMVTVRYFVEISRQVKYSLVVKILISLAYRTSEVQDTVVDFRLINTCLVY